MLNSLEEELLILKKSLSNSDHNHRLSNIDNNRNLLSNDSNINKGLFINSISKTYKNRKVVNNVSLNLKKGEAVGLLGPNGAGKTTCFYIIAGLIEPDSGEIYIDNEPINHLPMYMRAKKGIGYLPQESSIFRGLTVEDNILSILETHDYTVNEKFHILEDLISEFSINTIRKSFGSTLSGGERRRVEIARCLATNPNYILLDEPLAGIDPIAIKDVKNLINKLKSKNIGVLITDHNVRETLGIVDKAYILFDGSVMMSGNPNEIKSHKGVRDVYLGDSF
ncbi:LPS export ABC transporter ATP-binding protein [Alphaproteobacteria bacterium]|jgi:lipopolysaccharide export system ATP-binding protein|nr:LPS export ABC transporter ATP-binding protein [Alphaproteobacteria bacterium]|tara:strand:- start:6221 stop:7060 length:840 start_codon:yes stop_codon:yes gene_type:complete